MYQAPQGRPISSPPDESIFAPYSERRGRRFTQQEKDAIRADYQAGLTYAAIKEKHGLTSNKSVARLTEDIKNRRDASKPSKPARELGESNIDYAARVQRWMRENIPGYATQFESNRLRGLKNKTKKSARLAELACRKLNQTETRGRWVTMRSYMRETGLKRGGAGRRIYASVIERRYCWNQVAIYLLPHEHPADTAPAVLPLATPPAPPTLWQRFVAIFKS